MTKLVVFDTMICTWGILNRSDRNNLVSRCKALLKTLKDEGYDVAVPAPVLGELFAVVPIKEQAIIYKKIEEVVRIYPFDVLASEVYGEMIYNFFNSTHPEDLKRYALDNCIPRQKVKVDYMVAAIAKTIGAEFIYTEDTGLRKFASPYITVNSVPSKLFVEPKKISAQITLFGSEPYIDEDDEMPNLSLDEI